MTETLIDKDPSHFMPRYEPLDFHLLRAPALPVDVWRDALAEGDPGRTRARLRAMADDPRVRHGLVAAGSGLLDGLAKAEGADPGGKDARRVHSSALRYLTRMSTRPTPFGAFSGVALGTFGDTTTARLGDTAVASARVRADMGWLLALVQRLEGDAEVLNRLGVAMNALAYPVGDRLVLPSSDVHGKADRRSVRVRHTAPLGQIRRLAPAAFPVPYAVLVGELTERFPEAGEERISAFVTELVGLGLLVTDLRPPVTEARPETYVLDRLTAAGVEHPAVAGLREVVELLRTAVHGDTGGLEKLRAAQRALVPGYRHQPFQVDSALGLTGTVLHRHVADEIADAVGCLARLGQGAPGGYDHLAPYHQAFMERYGTDALVPVCELLSAERGLDAPNGYLNPPRAMVMNQHGGEGDPHTARALVALAADVWRRGAEEVELSDEVVARLLNPEAAPTGIVCPGVDAYAQIVADSADAIDRGDWRAVLNSDGLGEGGRTFGRFFHLLDPSATERLRAYARAREALEPDVVVAELAYLPSNGRGANVAIRPAVHGYEIPVNVAPSAAPDQVVDLADIHVGATDDGFRLYSARLGRELVVVQNHMLSPLAAPNVCRFLLEVSRARYRVPTGFTWGPVEGAPYLPRVVRGRVVVRAAEWNLYPAGAQAPAGAGPVPVPRTAADVADWRRTWGVPRHVYLADDDNRLLLDLDHPACVDELLADLRAATDRVTLQEALPGPDRTWLRDAAGRGHLSEIVVPLIAGASGSDAGDAGDADDADDADDATRDRERRRHREAQIRLRADPAAHPGHLPGSEWSYLKLYAARDVHDEIVAGELPRLGAELDRWFYIRYADPDPHLRIRSRSAPGTGLEPLLSWGQGLVRRGLAERMEIATYHPEVSRYGGPAVYDRVEELFTANSAVSVELLRLLWDKEPGLEAEAVTVAAVDTLYAQWGLGIRERLAAMPRPAEDKEARERYKKDRDYLCELLEPWDRRPHPLGRAHHERLAAVLDGQAEAVRRAARAVADAEAAGTLWGTRDGILASLAHMQVNRLLPMDRPAENRCYLVWGHILNCLRGRPRGR
ncbi:lantibiotic dehydratase [Streptomyces sp. TRM49041]|uniref:lantibiotic dehydratase n=1 Tax=Streptomyces sp. TRM49041 TaxID=2603216 RepID=UPI0021CC54CB|nr:lantibiotic dehydratase [Streptomyces sp. TRM49041]